MRVFRLTPTEEKEIKIIAEWLQLDNKILLNLMLKNQIQYLKQQHEEYKECKSACIQIEALNYLTGVDHYQSEDAA